MPVKWDGVALAPAYLVLLGDFPSLTTFQTILVACIAWTPLALGYGWLTRRIPIPFALLGVYPTIWAAGIGLILLAETLFSQAG